MNFTFQGGYPAWAGMSTWPKQLIMSAVRRGAHRVSRAAAASPKQVLLAMQLSAILLLALGLQVSAATYSQTVSFTGKDVPLKTVFASVKKQTGYGVFFENGEAMLSSSANVTLDLKNVPLEVFLRVCLKDQPLDYVLEGKTIFIKKKEPVVTLSPAGDAPPAGPIIQIKGRVTNDKGEPLVNANITVKRTGRGTITDANGNFYLHDVTSDDVVSVSFIGYKTQLVPLKDRISLTVVMSATTNDLDKVVVQAYGTTSQRLATGNIGVVRAEDIEKQPVMNVLQAVQGQVAGVVVTSTSGYASGTVKVEIRGRNTINSNFPSDPLYIIDGVPLTIIDLQDRDSYQSGSQGVIQSGIYSPANGQSPFFNFNPSDIESIEILKDADATAIYGSRGANGVILITTKKGKSGKTHFDFSVYTGVSHVARYYPLLNTKQYVAMRKEALSNDGLPIDINNAADLVAWDTTRYTDWEKYLWGGLGKTTNAQASISGGDARTTFRIGAGYQHETEILTSSGANQRASLSFNIANKTANQRLKIELSGTYTLVSGNMINLPGSAVNLSPNAPAVWDKNGSLNYAGYVPLDNYFPFGSLLQPYTTRTNLLNSSLNLSYELFKGLQLRSNFGYNNIQTNQTQLTPIASLDPEYNLTGSATFGSSLIHNVIIEPQAEYNKFVGPGKLTVLTGASLQANTTSATMLLGQGYNNDLFLNSIINAPVQSASNFEGQYKYEAVFGRISYNWGNKIILNLNGRRDGSSRFAPGRQFGNFGSVGIAWIITEENWVKKNLPFLSLGKARASFGTTGGDQVGNYAYLSQWIFRPFQYNNVQPLYPRGHTDSTYHWQVNRKTEIALTLGFLKDFITLDVSWYRNRCNDQLINFPTPYFTGFNNVIANSPANVENKGWEITLNSKIIDNQDFRWSVRCNLGINRNKLISYPNLSQSPFSDTYIIGQSLNIRKLLHATGVDSQTGNYTFQDKNKDGQITMDFTGKSDDRYPHDLSPRFEGGISTNLAYKTWELSLFFYFKKQIGANALNTLSAPGDNTNQPIEILNHWQKPGDQTSIARFTTNSYTDNSFYNRQNSDALFTDASYIRLQNLSLSYSLPEKISQKISTTNCRLFIQCQNLLLFTKYKGVDPEIQSFVTLPMPRVITGGIFFNF